MKTKIQLIILFFSIFAVFSFQIHAEVKIPKSTQKRRAVPLLPTKPNLEVPYTEKSFSRVDPHGSKHVKPTHELAQKTNECLVCHFFQATQLKTKSISTEICFNCHNKSPHSGVREHENLNPKITCVDCHSFHRGESQDTLPTSGLFKKFRAQEIEAGLVRKETNSGMLKKSCTECHKL